MNLKEQAKELATIKPIHTNNLNISDKDRKVFLKYKKKITKEILKAASKKEFIYVYITGVSSFERVLHKFFTGFNYIVALLLKEYFESEGFRVNEIKPNDLYLAITWFY